MLVIHCGNYCSFLAFAPAENSIPEIIDGLACTCARPEILSSLRRTLFLENHFFVDFENPFTNILTLETVFIISLQNF